MFRQRAAGALHRGHGDAHCAGDVAVLHAALLMILIGTQQYLRPMPFAHRSLARYDCPEFLAFFLAQLDSIFLLGHPCLSLFFQHPSTVME
jgi:hypothetical protein